MRVARPGIAVAPGPEAKKFGNIRRQPALARVIPKASFLRMPALAEPDHELIAHERQLAIYRAMTPQQRLQQALRMNSSMRKLMAAGFRARQPTWTDEQVKRAVADRILHARTG